MSRVRPCVIYQAFAKHEVGAGMLRVVVLDMAGEEIYGHSHERAGLPERALASVVDAYRAIAEAGALEQYTGHRAVRVAVGELSEVVR